MDWTKPLPTRRLWVLNGPLASERNSLWRILKQSGADAILQTMIWRVLAVESPSVGAYRTIVHAGTHRQATLRRGAGTAKPIGHELEAVKGS